MNTDKVQTQKALLQILGNIAPEADLNALREDADLRQTLGIDSYDFLNFMIGIHEAFGIEIPETDYGKLITLADVTQYVEAH